MLVLKTKIYKLLNSLPFPFACHYYQFLTVINILIMFAFVTFVRIPYYLLQVSVRLFKQCFNVITEYYHSTNPNTQQKSNLYGQITRNEFIRNASGEKRSKASAVWRSVSLYARHACCRCATRRCSQCDKHDAIWRLTTDEAVTVKRACTCHCVMSVIDDLETPVPLVTPLTSYRCPCANWITSTHCYRLAVCSHLLLHMCARRRFDSHLTSNSRFRYPRVTTSALCLSLAVRKTASQVL